MDADLLLTEDLTSLSDDQLVDAVVTFSGHMNAAEYRLICLVDAMDLRRARGICGVDSIPAWLGYHCGLDGNASIRSLLGVRVAGLCRHFVRGRSIFRPLRDRKMVHPHSSPRPHFEARPSWPPGTDRVLARRARFRSVPIRSGGSDRHCYLHGKKHHRRRRGLDWWFDDDGMLVIRGRLAPEDGALFIRAIEAVCTRMKADERAAEAEDLKVRVQGDLDEEADSPPQARRADALVEILEAGLGNVDAELPGGDRTLVVMHVPVPEAQGDASRAEPSRADTIFADAQGREKCETGINPLHHPPVCELEDGPAVPHHAARRIACDASVVTHHEHSDGRVASIGRRSRTVPFWLRRALKHRDGGCRFPGCDRTRHVDAHHVVHWAEGGETSLDNLVLLCRHHHRQIHEGRFHVRPTPAGDFAFDTADGRTLPNTFPQQRGDCGELVRMNMDRGLAIDGRSRLVENGYSARPDYSGSVAALWSATHGDALRPAAPHPGHCAFWPPQDDEG